MFFIRRFLAPLFALCLVVCALSAGPAARAQERWPSSWQAIFAPAGTPQPIVDRLYAEIARILKSDEVKEHLASLGMEPSGMAPAALTALQRAESEKWARVVKAANVKFD